MLAAIAAHEVAHDVLLHSRRAQDAAALLKFVAELLSIAGGADPEGEATIRSWLESTALPRYSQKHEFEADARAVLLLDRMGDPRASHTYERTLNELLGRYGNAGGGFLDSHPATTERIARLKAIR